MQRVPNPMISGCLSGLMITALFSLCLLLFSGYLILFQPEDPAAIQLRAKLVSLAVPARSDESISELLAALFHLGPPADNPPEEAPLPPVVLPPELENTLFALTYGRKDGWGSLRLARSGTHAITMASQFAAQVQEMTHKQVIPIVNPVIREKANGRYDAAGDPWITEIIHLAAAHQVIVMLDIQLGEECLDQGKAIIDDYASYEHVWFDVDVEHSCGGEMTAAQIDELAAYFNTQRTAHGFTRPALFGFWYFMQGTVSGQPQRHHGAVLVVPMYDGFVSHGGIERKVIEGHKRLGEMGVGPTGVMWFPKHDLDVTLAQIMQGFPQVLIVAQQ